MQAFDSPNFATFPDRAGASARADSPDVYLCTFGFLQGPSVSRLRFTASGIEVETWDAIEAPFDPAEYVVRQHWCRSNDGTRVPMFVLARASTRLDGTAPAVLYGYGGFNITTAPTFSALRIALLEQGVVYASANMRGGGEYGEKWHEAGTKLKKQNVFDDFLAAAEWLIANKYTSTPKLAIYGGSNGGLLVGACLTQRPDLYGAVVCEVPVIDMLRYHRFTLGRYWTGEYGDAEHNAEQFKFLYAYSPLHNVKEGVHYPPTLILTADTDDRVVPAHAKKFTATIQRAHSGEPAIVACRVKGWTWYGQADRKDYRRA